MKQKTKISQKSLTTKIIDALILYLQTQFLVMAVVTLLSWFILHYLGVPLAILLAVMTGALSSIPVLGILTASILASLVVIFDNARFLPNAPEILEGIIVLVVYGILNVGIDWLLAPYVTGKMVKIHPLIILISVILGSAFFGIVGAMLAVPVLLVVKTINEHEHR